MARATYYQHQNKGVEFIFSVKGNFEYAVNIFRDGNMIGNRHSVENWVPLKTEVNESGGVIVWEFEGLFKWGGGARPEDGWKPMPVKVFPPSTEGVTKIGWDDWTGQGARDEDYNDAMVTAIPFDASSQ